MSTLELGSEHGPRLISAIARSLSNFTQDQLKEVTADLGWSRRICKPDCEEFFEMFNLPRDIPLEKIIQSVAEMNKAVYNNNQMLLQVNDRPKWITCFLQFNPRNF